MSTAAATANVREILATLTGRRPSKATISGLTTPLGETITVTVSEQPATMPGHIDARLTLAEMNRGDNDTDLGVFIDPSALVGLDEAAPEAWNVHMTLPTLLRILGADTTNQKA